MAQIDWDARFCLLENRMLDITMQIRWDVQDQRQVPEARLRRIEDTAKAFVELAAKYEEARLKAEAEREKEYADDGD